MRQHIDARYSNSVRLSVRRVPVLYEKGLTYCHSFFTTRHQPNYSSCISIKHLREIPTGSPPYVAHLSDEYRWSIKISRFSTNKSIFRHITTKNGTQAFELHQFQWPWVTSNPNFRSRIIQCHITRKWYIQDRAIWSTNRIKMIIKLYTGLSNGVIFSDLERPL